MANDDWDLGAVVRGCRASGEAAATIRRNPFASFPPPAATFKAEEEAEDSKGASFLAFPDLFRRQDAFQELEELCRAFLKGQEIREAASASSPPLASAAPLAAAVVAGPHQTPPARQLHRSLSQMPRLKRRKNQQKKVVCHVSAAGLSSDVWAWRKYGQKPIKGSPYPRGYYRCSSSKGCLARKQVERSRADPAMFIITYTAEHNHPVPTHRNSLAGSTRHKFPSVVSAVASGGEGGGACGPSSSSTASGFSPTTPLTASMEDELLRRLPQKGEDVEEADEDEADEDEDILLVEDMEMIGEDDLLFMGNAEEAGGGTSASAAEAAMFLEDKGGLEDHFFAPPWLSNSNNAAAAAGGI